MLQAGKNLTQQSDVMQKIAVKQLYNSLIKPKAEVYNQIQQLRIIKTIDTDKYRKLKVQLPYFTTGIFNPPIRKTENFAWIKFLILDFDHINEKGIDINNLKNKLITDQRLVLLFTSPGGDGLKIIFELSEKCYDAAKYSMFYKIFAKSFAMQYGLEQVVDQRTSDVTRACFISCDESAYYNPTAITLEMKSFIDFDNFSELTEAKDELKRWDIEMKENNPQQPKVSELTTDLLSEIKGKLNPKFVKQKNIFVPEELELTIERIKHRLNELGLHLENIESIHYGKKLRISLDHRWTEINVFYGKKGFSVVKTTKSGSNAELAEVAKDVLEQLLLG